MVMKTYKYRIYPTSKQKVRLINNFRSCKFAYNNLLAISADAHKFGNVSLTKFDYDSIIKDYPSSAYSQVMQNVSDRLYKAFQNFFRRVKDPSCTEKGFPRFKSRVNSITYPQKGFKFRSEKRLYASKIGNMPIVLHRVPRGTVKTLTIKQNRASQWFAYLSCELDDKIPSHPSTKSVGIDVGIESFAVLSDGEFIANPRHLAKSEPVLKRLQRRLSKKKKGSFNRRKAKFLVSRQHQKVVDQREDFLHKTTHYLTTKYSLIAVEDLNITQMLKNHYLAKHISDASWGTFMSLLSYKAVTRGGQLFKVDPRNTSKTCSKCGSVIDLKLSDREFSCPCCGFVCHRDLNAAVNIHGRAGLVRTLTPADDCVIPLFGEVAVAEPGTIC